MADNAVFVSANGNVGIGTTDPQSILNIYSGANTGSVRVDTTTGVAEFRLRSAINNVNWEIFTNAGATLGDNTTLGFWSGLSVKMAITNAGNVGIGATIPAQLLHVYASAGNNSIIQTDSSAGGGQAGLKIVAGNGSSSRASRIDFLNVPASATVPRWTLINDYNQNGTNDLSLVNAAGTYSILTVLQNGNVGIGTANPDHPLSVIQSAQGKGITQIKAASTIVVGNAGWHNIYQMNTHEHGLYWATANNYGGSWLLFIHYNWGSNLGQVLNVVSSGGDGSGYNFSWQITATGMVQTQHSTGSYGIPVFFTKIGGF